MVGSSTKKISFGLLALHHDERDEALAKNEKECCDAVAKMHDMASIRLRVLDDTRSSHNSKMWRGKR